MFVVKNGSYQEMLEIQQSFARQLDELGKTLRFSREESEAYARLDDAYDEEVKVSKIV